MGREATITINGVRLNDAQSSVVRVAMTTFDPGELGSDAHGVAMQRLYRQRRDEVLRMLGVLHGT